MHFKFAWYFITLNVKSRKNKKGGKKVQIFFDKQLNGPNM